MQWLIAFLIMSGLVITLLVVTSDQRNLLRMKHRSPAILTGWVITNAIGLFEAERGALPASAQELVQSGCLEKATAERKFFAELLNPYTGKPLRSVEPGEAIHEGDWLYLPARVVMTEFEPYCVTDGGAGYYLFVFGRDIGFCWTEHLHTDFNLDGIRDEVAYWDGTPQKYGGSWCSQPESIDAVLKRIGKAACWLGQPMEQH